MSDDNLKSTKGELPTSEYEVSSLVDICYGDPTETGKRGLKFMVNNLPLSSRTNNEFVCFCSSLLRPSEFSSLCPFFQSCQI